jgi:hypothetical protein
MSRHRGHPAFAGDHTEAAACEGVVVRLGQKAHAVLQIDGAHPLQPPPQADALRRLGYFLHTKFRLSRRARRLKMMENDITEMGGESVILESVALDRLQAEKVVARLKADRDDAYHEFIDKCGDFETEINKETAAQHFTYNELE